VPDVLRNVHFCSGRMLEGVKGLVLGLGLGVEGPVLGLSVKGPVLGLGLGVEGPVLGLSVEGPVLGLGV